MAWQPARPQAETEAAFPRRTESRGDMNRLKGALHAGVSTTAPLPKRIASPQRGPGPHPLIYERVRHSQSGHSCEFGCAPGRSAHSHATARRGFRRGVGAHRAAVLQHARAGRRARRRHQVLHEQTCATWPCKPQAVHRISRHVATHATATTPRRCAAPFLSVLIDPNAGRCRMWHFQGRCWCGARPGYLPAWREVRATACKLQARADLLARK